MAATRSARILAGVMMALTAGAADGAGLPGPAAVVPQPPLVLVADTRSLLREAADLMDQGAFDAALDRIDQVLRSLPATGGGKVARQRRAALTMKARTLAGLGRFAEGEALLKQVIAELDGAGGRDSEESISPLVALASLYVRRGDWTDAEGLFARALSIRREVDPGNRLAQAELQNNLGVVRLQQGNLDAGIADLEAALDVYRRAGPEAERDVASVTSNLGGAYQTRGEFDRALEAFNEAYGASSSLLGPTHPSALVALSNVAVLYGLMGRPAEGLPAIETVLAATVDRYGPDHVQTALVINNRGWLELGAGDPASARADLDRALAIYRANTRLQATGLDGPGAGVDGRQVSRTILGLLIATSRLPRQPDPDALALTDGAFLAAQEARHTKAELALLQTAARFASGSGDLAALIRERQDLAARRRDVDRWLTSALAFGAEGRDTTAEGAARAKLASLSGRIEELDAVLLERFPDYAAIVRPAPVGLADVQQQLGPKDALVLVAPFGGANGEGLFTFVVTDDDVRWLGREDYGETRLTEDVRALRCGLDLGAWKDGSGSGCAAAGQPPQTVEDLPFDPALAHRIAVAVLGDLTPMLEGRTVYVVAPDPLASLPLHVLLASPPPAGWTGDFASLDWLGRHTAFANLPSVASLPNLARARGGAPASKPYLGFGDPALEGSLDCPVTEAADVECPGPGAPVPVSVASLAPRIDAVTRGGSADVDAVRALCPLPDSATELRCVAERLGAEGAAVRTGLDATLPAVLTGSLADYRVIQFATHGLLAGEMQTEQGFVSEPALVLTPPDVASAEDDGLLRASAVAGLKLNADWVILSACNTAAGESLGGEALSGLASAFLYAGARALLVSHWPVRSDAAVLLTTTAFAAIAADADVGRAEAMRRAMNSLISDPSGRYAHPAVWAPFSVVGDGGPPRR